MTTLYVLELENGKYYVGTTNRSVNDRVLEHLTECGSEWTHFHKPNKIIETKYNVDKYDEDKYTKMYMDKYGINNVRGGSYVSVVLPDYQLEALKRELKTSNDECFKCGRTGHYANDCFATTDTNGKSLDSHEWYCEYCHNVFDTQDKAITHEKICEKNTYINKVYNWMSGVVSSASDKYYKTSRSKYNEIKIQYADDKCYRCGRSGHYASDCYAKTSIQYDNDKCYRCGRSGHYASECYAKQHVNGYKINRN